MKWLDRGILQQPRYRCEAFEHPTEMDPHPEIPHQQP